MARGDAPAARIITKDELPRSGTARQFEGSLFGDVGVAFFLVDGAPGTGPGLHTHPYAEVFVVQEGHATFTVGDETIEATSGQIVIVPAGRPHRFVNSGGGPLRQITIHASGQMVTDWLEE